MSAHGLVPFVFCKGKLLPRTAKWWRLFRYVRSGACNSEITKVTLLDALDTPQASRIWTLGALWTVPVLWTLWGVQTRVVLINCCIPKYVEMVWRPAQESNLQASRLNQLEIWATYEITVQYMCNWKSTLKRRCKPMSLKDFFTRILEGYLILRT